MQWWQRHEGSVTESTYVRVVVIVGLFYVPAKSLLHVCISSLIMASLNEEVLSLNLFVCAAGPRPPHWADTPSSGVSPHHRQDRGGEDRGEG